jgi:phosphatidate phosphatase APP1
MNKQRNSLMNKQSYKSSIKHWLGMLSSPQIVPFIGFGNNYSTYIIGEVVEENGISKPKEGQSTWQNIAAMIRRYVSNEIEGVKVEVKYLEKSQIVTTDKHGIFRCTFEHASPVPDKIWHKAYIRLAEPGYDSDNEVTGEVLTITRLPQFGIISDVDDTIMVSYAAQKIMKLRLMLMNNAHTRMPFEGVSAFYYALQRGTSNDGYNPVFYVSNSEWNLYDLIYEFIQFHRIPKGPLLLREMAIRLWRPWKIKEVNKNHKSEVITKIFSMYVGLKFILIGDSGQRDPEVYLNIVREFPGRVLAIYIRDIGIPEKSARIKTISQRVLDEYNTEMLLVKDTEAAAMHAVAKGFISGYDLDSIIDEKQKDVEKKDILFAQMKK